MKGIQTARDVKSNLNSIIVNRKERYEKSIGNYRSTYNNNYSDYINSDLLVQFGLFIGIMSTAIVFISLIQLTNYINPVQNTILLTSGIFGLKYANRSFKKGLGEIFDNG